MAEHKYEVIPVTTERDGSTVDIGIHEFEGGSAGPTLGLLSLQHGDEWFSLLAMRRVASELATMDFRGLVIMVPVCSPPALRELSRVTQVSSDEPDMNRAWSSRLSWLTGMLTSRLHQEVVARCDALIDFHLGPWGSAFSAVCYGQDYRDARVNARSKELAVGFGHRCIRSQKAAGVFPGPQSATGYSGSFNGIPSIAVEIGGAGFGEILEREWIQSVAAGVRGAMATLGMTDEGPAAGGRILDVHEVVRVNPSRGGLLVPEHDPEELLRPVTEGEALGRVISPSSLVELETLESPCSGWLFGAARSYPVRPGEWAFAVAPTDATSWLEVGPEPGVDANIRQRG